MKETRLSRYIIPSVISMVLVGTYTNIDGLFIGNVTGNPGLAAINFAWPIVAFITSLGTGIGIGGSVLLNRARGAGEEERADRLRSVILLLLLASGVLFGAIFKFTSPFLLTLMGAAEDPAVYEYALIYADVISIGAVFQVVGAGFVALLRNEGKTWISMLSCALGLVLHILLDALLVEKYTLAGVAVSTVVSQAAVALVCLLALRKCRFARPSAKDFSPVLRESAAPLGINFVPSVVLLFTNFFAMSVGGTAAVTAYTVMSYAVYTFDYAFQGVCDGVQPVISYAVGANDKGEERRALSAAYKVLGISVLLSVASTPLLMAFLPDFFGADSAAAAMMQSGFIIYAASYPFKAAVKYFGSYFYAKGRALYANLLIYADPLLLTPLLLLALPPIFGIDGVWLSLTLAQLALTLPGIFLFVREMKKA